MADRAVSRAVCVALVGLWWSNHFHGEFPARRQLAVASCPLAQPALCVPWPPAALTAPIVFIDGVCVCVCRRAGACVAGPRCPTAHCARRRLAAASVCRRCGARAATPTVPVTAIHAQTGCTLQTSAQVRAIALAPWIATRGGVSRWFCCTKKTKVRDHPVVGRGVDPWPHRTHTTRVLPCQVKDQARR